MIGSLPGKTRPNEYVIYTAHWAHLGRCDADLAGGDTCNGALDNASGTAGLIARAQGGASTTERADAPAPAAEGRRAVAQANAKAGAEVRWIVFPAGPAEESGLLGSKY